jgi:hypothetical protein
MMITAAMLVRVVTMNGSPPPRWSNHKPGWRRPGSKSPTTQRKLPMAKPELKPVAETEIDPIVETEIDPVVEAITTQEKPDPFDLDKLRLDQSFVESAGVKKLLTKVPVQKPDPQTFVRVHPSEKYRTVLAVIMLKEDSETFLLTPPIARELPGEFVMVMMYTAINRQGVTFLWPIRLPDPDGRINEWHSSAAQAVEHATKRWVRVKANKSLRGYEIYEAASTIPKPTWPDVSFQELIRIAFRDRLVNSLDHAVIKRLRGA